MAIASSGLRCELREVSLKNKPAALLEASPKATVPVLCLPDGNIIEQSIEIMEYALRQRDPDGWYDLSDAAMAQYKTLVEHNDVHFAPLLTQYKYVSRYPEHSQEYYREQCQTTWLDPLEDSLTRHAYLLGDKQTIADVALMPFIRQFAGVDSVWFDGSKYVKTNAWLKKFVGSDLFKTVMVKHEPWLEGDAPILFP